MKVKSRKNSLKIILICFGLFILSLILLMGSSSVLTLAESKIILASNQAAPSAAPVAYSEVAGIATNTVEITDLKVPSPQYTSKAIIAEDVDLNRVLFSKNNHNRMSPASTTKIMT